MQTAKQSLEEMLRTLPDDASFADVQDRLHLMAKLQERLASVDAGGENRVATLEEVTRSMAERRSVNQPVLDYLRDK